MKNFLFIVCSVFAFTFATFSCSQKSQKADVLKSDTIKTKVLVSVNVADTLEKLEAQNFVADTSYTSVQSSLVSAQNLANQIDEATYKASLAYDRVYSKIRKLERLEHQLDDAIVKSKNVPVSIFKPAYVKHYQEPDTSLSIGYRLSYQYRK
jgi:hypothetical protein